MPDRPSTQGHYLDLVGSLINSHEVQRVWFSISAICDRSRISVIEISALLGPATNGDFFHLNLILWSYPALTVCVKCNSSYCKQTVTCIFGHKVVSNDCVTVSLDQKLHERHKQPAAVHFQSTLVTKGVWRSEQQYASN